MKLIPLFVVASLVTACSFKPTLPPEATASSEPVVDGAVPTPRNDEDLPSKKGHLFSSLNTDQEQDVALAINLSGNLCGKVIGAVPMGSLLLVECQEYRRREGHYVRYWISGLGEQQRMHVEKGFVLKPSGWQKVN